MSANHEEERPETAKPPAGRRSFIRKAAAAALGGTVATLGLEGTASASARTTRKHPKLKAIPDLYHVDCCELAYNKFCSPSQERSCTDHWSWTCCAYVGSNLTRVTCYECYSAHCSNAIYSASC